MKIVYYDIETKELLDTELEELELSNEYKSLKNIDRCFFSSHDFHMLHMKNAEQVYRIIIKNKNSLLAEIYCGIRNNELYLPYSSPFFYLNEFKNIRDEEYFKISELLKHLKEKLNLKKIKITFSPKIYNERVENIIGIFLNNDFKVKYYDVNHYFDLKSDLNQDRSIKKDINLAKKYNLIFEKSSLKDSYIVIKKNREERNFPLRMSEEHLEKIKMLKNAEVETFIVKNEVGDSLAAAIIFKVKEGKYQVVYWGNIKDESYKKPMAFLVENLLSYYKEKAEILDIGPSSEEGIINFGLSQFKRNIGCKICNKITLHY
ncbi:hypothetical protein [Cetobacterium sp.]|uniref:hypothetical protein n=1 Tax=Cetobacterium sp. TaxID=2071632 RepID=UPI003F33D6D8